MELKELVRGLRGMGYVKSEGVEETMLKVDRAIFVPEKMKRYAYLDSPLEIGHGQTISAPHMVAIMLEVLKPLRGDRILEIGTGSGYNAALLGTMVGDKGRVFTVERVGALAALASENMGRAGVHNVEVIVGDGSLGYGKAGPYDGVVVACGAPQLPPSLMDQTRIGGKIVIPIGSHNFQTLYMFTRDEGGLKRKSFGDVLFVPLIGKYGFEL